MPTPDYYSERPDRFREELLLPTGTGVKMVGEILEDFQRDQFDYLQPLLDAVRDQTRPPTPRVWHEMTKGAGKDTMWAINLLWLLLVTKRPLRIQVAAVDSEQADETRLIIKSILRTRGSTVNQLLADTIEVKAASITNKRTDSEVQILTADQWGSHGSRIDALILNELTHQQSSGFAETLLDNADKMPNCLVAIVSNSGVDPSWQLNWKRIAEASEDWLVLEYSRPAPWISERALQEAEKRNPPSRYKRLWWGQWTPPSGDALPPEDIDACVQKGAEPFLPISLPSSRRHEWDFTCGVDLSVSKHHSALVVLGVNRHEQRVRLAYCRSWKPNPRTKRIDLGSVEREIFDLHRQYKFKHVAIDPYQAALMVQTLQHHRVPIVEYHFTPKHLMEMASATLDAFRNRSVVLYPHQQLVSDLKRLVFEEKSYGFRLVVDKATDNQSTEHGDLATAFVIALANATPHLGKRKLQISSHHTERSTTAMFLDYWEKRQARFERDREKDEELSQQRDDPIVETIRQLRRSNL